MAWNPEENHPLKSASTWVVVDAPIHTADDSSIATIAPLAMFWLATKLIVDVLGRVDPHGHTVKNPSDCG